MAGPGLAKQRVAAISAIGPSGTELGSGYLIGPRTVLTAGHVVPADAERVELGFAGDDRVRQAEVVWSRTGSVDAAVLTLTDPDLPAWLHDAEPVRFGRFVTGDGVVAADAQGFPRARERGGRRGLEPVTGNIPCGAADDGRSHLVITGAPPVSGAGAWRGMSGAAVWAAGLLVGVVTADSTEWDGGRLRYQPIDVLAADPGFTRAATSGELVVDAVELVELAPSPAPARPGSPAQLLRAESRIIDFHGRHAELARLQRWCEGAGSSVMLMHAQGGQGKTRLALELLTRQRALGWSCGVARADFDRMAAALACADVERALRRSSAPVLIMIDYAEAWRSAGERSEDPVRTLLRLIGSRADATAGPIRILLVARSPGTWWAELRGKFTGSAFDELTLGRLAVALDLRLRLYREALNALAARLTDVPDYRETEWSRRIERIATPEELWRPRFGHALTLYEQALADLLQSGPRPVRRSGSTEDILLGHESTYWRRTAEAYGLDPDPGPLRESVAAVTLFGASTERQAANLVDSLPAVRQREPHYRARVVRWLADLYPDPYSAWGPLEPDRLGEYLIATVWGADDELVELVQGHLLPDDTHRDAAARLSDGQIYRMLIVLDRAARHRDHLRGIQRTVFFLRAAGRTLPRRQVHERHEYLRLDAQKARVPARYTDRIAARFPAGAGWRSRWAWWNAQRKAARIFAVHGEVYLALVEIDGRTVILAVGAVLCSIHDPDTGQALELCSNHDTSATTILTAAHGKFGNEFFIVLGMSDGMIQVCHHDESGWGNGFIGEPLAPTDLYRRTTSLVVHRFRGRPVAVGAQSNGSLTMWDLTTGETLATRPDSITGPHGDATDMAVIDRPTGPILVTTHDNIHGIRVFDLLRLERIAAFERAACAIAPLPPTEDSGSPEWRVMTGRSDGSLEIIDLGTGAVIARMAGHSRAVTGIRVELGGEFPMVVTTSEDRTVISWDLRTGDPLGTAYVGHTDKISALTTGRLGDDLVAVTGSADFTIRVWNLADANLPEAALTGHTETITGVALARDSGRNIAVTAGVDRTVRIWDLEAGGRAGAEGLPDLYRTQLYETVTAVAAAVHDDEVYIVTGGMDGGLFALAPVARQETCSLEHQVTAMDCRRVGDRILAAAAAAPGRLRCWDARTGAALGPAAGCGDPVHTIRLVMVNGRPMAVVATAEVCTTIDPATGSIDSSCHGEPFEHEHLIGLELLDDRPTVLVAEPGAQPGHCVVRAIDLRTREQVGVRLEFPERVRAARLYPSGVPGSGDGHLVLACGDDYQLWVRSLAADDHSPPVGVSGKGGPGTAHQPPAALTRLAGSTAILIGGDDGELELVDGRTGIPVIDTEPVNPTGVTVAGLRGRPAVVVASGRRKLAFRDLGKGERIEAAVAAPPGIAKLRTIEVAGAQVVLGASMLGQRAWQAHAMTPVPLDDGLHYGSANSATVSIGDDTIVITARDDELRTASVLHGAPYRPGITGLGAGGVGKRVLVAAHVFRGRPIVFTAGMLQDTLRMWDLWTGAPTGPTLEEEVIHLLMTGAVDGTDVLYVANVVGLVSEWPIDTLFQGPLRRLLRTPRPRRMADCGGQLGAALIHPELGLVVATGSAVRLRPFDADDPLPIHLDAPVTGLALGDQGSIVVNTEQGIVLLDLDVSPGRHSAG
ncbi:hypothetical protein [Nocardia sp. NPDC057227]|uniref:hypothetical protein n=1 Tax=Nocardia sp. NPDC057227 TaxID=3346056 RepID=UPI003624B0CB